MFKKQYTADVCINLSHAALQSLHNSVKDSRCKSCSPGAGRSPGYEELHEESNGKGGKNSRKNPHIG